MLRELWTMDATSQKRASIVKVSFFARVTRTFTTFTLVVFFEKTIINFKVCCIELNTEFSFGLANTTKHFSWIFSSQGLEKRSSYFDCLVNVPPTDKIDRISDHHIHLTQKRFVFINPPLLKPEILSLTS